jgi:hypothetical protein
MITETSGFYIVSYGKWDHIKWLITLTSDNISLYLEFEVFFSKKKKIAIQHSQKYQN